MSLINEALKKAQKQRTGESTPLPAIGGESAERIARRAKPAGFNTLLLYMGGGVAALAVVIGAGVYLLRKNPPAPAPAPVAVAPAARPLEPAAPAPSPIAVPNVATVTTTPTPAPAFVVPAAPTTPPTVPNKIEAPAPVVLAETPKLVVAAALVTVAPVPAEAAPVLSKPEPAKPLVPGRLEPRAINYIESLHVAGIRASVSDAKVLMNDRVYRVGSMVEREMGLKLTGITANSLTFEDERGATYTRTF